MEFQAVIMAAGQGSRMTELTAGIPKCLLPVGGVPMIYHPLKMLEKAGFRESIIIVPDSEENEIQKALGGLTTMKLEFVSIPSGEDWGTTDSLRFIANKIKRDVLVVSCDLVADFPLYQLADVHRTHDSSLTMLFSPIPPSLLQATVPGRKGKEKPEKDFIGLDPDTGRVLFLNSEADLEDDVSFRTAVLRRYPVMKVNSNLLDMHVYIIKPWVVHYLTINKNISTMKGELLPLLVRKQFRKKPVLENSDLQDTNPSITDACIKKDVNDFVEISEISKMMEEISAWNHHWENVDDVYRGDKIRCFACISKEAFCMRANTIASYNEANKLIPKELLPWPSKRNFDPSLIHPKAKIGYESVIAPGTTIAEKADIKKSVVGKQCVIKEKVTLFNSIIMDHVTIEEGCTVLGCIISKDVTIGSGASLADCVVGKGQKIPMSGKYFNEIVMEENRLMEIG